jgi:hypothetical protein
MKNYFFSVIFIFCLININAQSIKWGINKDTSPNSRVIVFDSGNFEYTGAGLMQIDGLKNYATLGDWNLINRISSIVIPGNKMVILYEKTGFQGKSITLYPGNYPELGIWNDRASSLEVKYFDPTRPLAYFYDKFTLDTPQRWMSLPKGEYDNAKAELICNDCFSKIILPADLNAVVYVDNEFKGKNNEDRPFQIRSNEDLSEFHLPTFNFENNISSIKVGLQGYRLDSVEFKNEKIVEVGNDSILLNRLTSKNNGRETNSSTVQINKNFQSTITQTSSTSWSNSTGISVAIKVGTPKIFGLGSDITTTISNTTTIGEVNGNGKSISFTQDFNQSVTANTRPGCQSKINLIVQPIVLEYDMVKVYVQVDKDNKDIPNGKKITSTSKVRISRAQQGFAKIDDLCD